MFGFSIRVALFGRLLSGLLAVYRLVLLYGWVFVEAGLGSAFTPML